MGGSAELPSLPSFRAAEKEKRCYYEYVLSPRPDPRIERRPQMTLVLSSRMVRVALYTGSSTSRHIWLNTGAIHLGKDINLLVH